MDKPLLMLDPIKDLWAFVRERRKFWLAPILILLVVLGGLLLVVERGSVIAPFLYTLV